MVRIRFIWPYNVAMTSHQKLRGNKKGMMLALKESNLRDFFRAIKRQGVVFENDHVEVIKGGNYSIFSFM